MKDHRFIELLNLYIDRQITADETAELEAELQRQPKRQAVYRQYCQIYTATKVVYQSFRAGATEEGSVAPGRPAAVEMFGSRRRLQWAYYAGGLAAAACLALVLLRQQPVMEPASGVAAVRPRPQVTLATVPVAPVAKAASATVLPALEVAPRPVSLRNANPDYSAMLAALREQDEARAAGEHWQSGGARSLFDDNVFESKPAPVTPLEQRTLRRQTAAEFAAFQFQR